MNMIFKIVWRNIWRNKRRSFITISSIFFAVFFAVFMRSFQEGSYGNMVENMVGKYTGYLQIHQKGYWAEQSIDNTFSITDSLRTQLKNTPGVVSYNERLQSFALSANGNATKGALVIGANLEKESKLMNLDSNLVDGVFPDADSSKILISEGLASFYDITIGDSLILLSQGYHGASANGIFPIAGVVKHSLPSLNNRLILIPLKAAQELFAAPSMISSITLQLSKPKQLKRAKKTLLNKLNPETYEVMDWQELLPELVQSIVADKAGGIVIIGVLYMIITFGIIGTLLMMTAERMHEFGILIAIGMQKSKLIVILLLESLLLGVISSALGILAASPLCYYFHVNPIRLQGKAAEAIEAYGFEPVVPASIDFSIALDQTFIVLSLLLLCSMYPVWIILRLKPVKAMHS